MEPLSESLSRTRASSPTSSHGDGHSTSLLDVHNDSVLEASVPSIPDTPPTPQSHLSSPALPESVFPPVDPLLLASRRQQSDRASAAIGQKLLHGWTLLGDECQNPDCYAVPLMRRPNPNRKLKKEEESSSATVIATKPVDPRRHCVTCGRDYLREADLKAWELYQSEAQGLAISPSTIHGTIRHGLSNEEPGEDQILHSAAAKKRRYSAQPVSARSKNTPVISASGKGKERAFEVWTQRFSCHLI